MIINKNKNYHFNENVIVYFSIFISVMLFLIFYSLSFLNIIWENRFYEIAALNLIEGINPYTINYTKRLSFISQADGWVYGPLSLYFLFPVYLSFGSAVYVKILVLFSAGFHFGIAIISVLLLKSEKLAYKAFLFISLLLNPMFLVLGSQGDILDLGLIFLLILSLYFYKTKSVTSWITVCAIGILWKQVFWFFIPIMIIRSYQEHQIRLNATIFFSIIGLGSIPFVIWDPIAYLVTFIGFFSIYRELLIIQGNWWNFFIILSEFGIELIIIQIISWGLIISLWCVVWVLNLKMKIPMEYNYLFTMGIFALFYYSSYLLYFGWFLPILLLILVDNIGKNIQTHKLSKNISIL